MALDSTQANILAKELFLNVLSGTFFKKPKDSIGEINLDSQAVMQHREAYFVAVFLEVVSVLQG